MLYASWIGDGWCDNDDYNTPECNYDMGDCCKSTCNPVIHADCGVAGYQCKNPSAKENKLPTSDGWSGGGVAYDDGISNFSNSSSFNRARSSNYARDSNYANNKGDHGDDSKSRGRTDSNSKLNGTHGDDNSALNRNSNNESNNESHGDAGNSDCVKCSDSGDAASTYCKECNNDHDSGRHGGDGSTDGQKSDNGNYEGAHGTDNGSGNGQKGNNGHDNGGHGDDGSADGQKGSDDNDNGGHGTDNGGGKDQNSGDSNGGHAGDGDGNNQKGNNGPNNGGSRADDGGNTQKNDNGRDNGDHGNVDKGNSQNNNINDKVGISAGGNGGQANWSNFDLVFNAFNMSCDSSNEASVEKTIASAMINNIVLHSSTAIASVKLAPYSSNGQLPQTASAAKHGSNNEKRVLAGTLLQVMFAVTVSMQTQSSKAMSESLAMHQSIDNGLLQRSLRRTSKQSNVPALNWVRICRSNSPTICLAEHWLPIPRAQAQLDHCSMSTSDWDNLFERQGINRRHACRILINCFV